MEPLLDAVELETAPSPSASVVFLHGLGADGHDFEPIVPLFARSLRGAVRFVLPHAPVRPVTINGGMAMRAWYDILSMDVDRRIDDEGVLDSSRRVAALIDREVERGVPEARIVLAGFSQGGAIALHHALRRETKLAGVVALSTYLVRAPSLAGERAPSSAGVPILIGHGTRDPVVPVALGETARDTLQELGHAVRWRSWPMGHEVCEEEIDWVARFLAERLDASEARG